MSKNRKVFLPNAFVMFIGSSSVEITLNPKRNLPNVNPNIPSVNVEYIINIMNMFKNSCVYSLKRNSKGLDILEIIIAMVIEIARSIKCAAARLK